MAGRLAAAVPCALWVSDLVRAYGWIILLRETGIISQTLRAMGLVTGPVEFLYNDVTVIIGLVYTVILFMIVPLVSTLDGMDNSLIEAGLNLGGNRLTVLRRIVIPYAMPGIVSGSIIVFLLSAGSYLTPIVTIRPRPQGWALRRRERPRRGRLASSKGGDRRSAWRDDRRCGRARRRARRGHRRR